jgi:hypothetical protein
MAECTRFEHTWFALFVAHTVAFLAEPSPPSPSNSRWSKKQRSGSHPGDLEEQTDDSKGKPGNSNGGLEEHVKDSKEKPGFSNGGLEKNGGDLVVTEAGEKLKKPSVPSPTPTIMLEAGEQLENPVGSPLVERAVEQLGDPTIGTLEAGEQLQTSVIKTTEADKQLGPSVEEAGEQLDILVAQILSEGASELGDPVTPPPTPEAPLQLENPLAHPLPNFEPGEAPRGISRGKFPAGAGVTSNEAEEEGLQEVEDSEKPGAGRNGVKVSEQCETTRDAIGRARREVDRLSETFGGLSSLSLLSTQLESIEKLVIEIVRSESRRSE